MIKELKRVLFVSIVLSIMLIISMINASSLPRKKIGDKATCACCNVVLQEIRKDIDEELYSDNNKKNKKKKKNVEELVIESMSQICTEVKRFVTYNYPPPTMQAACWDIINAYEEKIERLMYGYAIKVTTEVEENSENDSRTTTNNNSTDNSTNNQLMDEIFEKVCKREACKGIDLETYMDIERSKSGIKTSAIEASGQFADQDEL